MRWLRKIFSFARQYLASTRVFLVYGIAAGVIIAMPLVPRPEIAVISLTGSIRQGMVDETLDTINDAMSNRRIRAVVFQIDSPGGEVCAIEQIYLDLTRLREKKPIVATVGTIAASGGYYVAQGANYIYAEKGSQIGSIGVWVRLPDAEELDETMMTTGLFKATGGSKRKVIAWLEMMRKQFTGVVISERGSRLKLTEEVLSRAEIYLGTEGLNYGLIDAIGTKSDAVRKAAQMAHIRNYKVIDISPESESLTIILGKADIDTIKATPHLVPVYYYLYFESE